MIDEKAWLIETDAFPPLFWGGRACNANEWGSPMQAIRFSRKEDAEKCIRLHSFVNVKATEHEWVSK